MDPVPVLSDLVWALDGEPEWTDDRNAVPWPYNSATWTLERGSFRLHLFIHAGYDEVRLRIASLEDGSDVVDLLLLEVRAIQVVRDPDRVFLRFHQHDDFQGDSLWLRVDAHLSIAWKIGKISGT